MEQLLITITQPTSDGGTKSSFLVGTQEDLDQFELIEAISVVSSKVYDPTEGKDGPVKPGKPLIEVKPKKVKEDKEDK